MTAPTLALLTMTSLEIGKVVKVRHDNVKRTVESIAAKGVIRLPQFEEVSNPGRGRKMVSVYRLSKRDSLIVVAQLCPEFTAKIVDRWQELEDQVAAKTGGVLQKLWELDEKELESKARATHGALLLNTRKRELHEFKKVRAELETQIQPSLLN